MIMAPGVGIPLQLIINPFDRALANAARSLDRFARRFSAPIRIPLQGIARTTEAARQAGQMVASIGGQMTRVGIAVARHAADMETMMTRLARVTDLPKDKFQALGDEIKQIAATTAGVKLEDIMGLATFGAKLGIAGDKLGMFTRDAAMFSQALDDIDVEEAATSFARLSVVFGTGIEQTRRYAAALVALDQAGTATGREILDITTRIAPMAKLLGMSPQRAMALATTVRETGVSSEVAGSSLTQILGKLGGGKDQANFARLAGMGDKAFAGLVKSDVAGALTKVGEALGKMDADKAISALEGLGIEGVRARQTLLGLASAGQKNAQFAAVANNEWRTMAGVQKAVALNSGTLYSRLKQLHNGFQLASAAIGEALLPILKGFSDGLVRLMADIRASIERNRDAFQAWGKRIGDTLNNVGALWRNWPDYVEYASVTIKEKFGQMGEVVRRFAALARAYLKTIGEDIEDYIGQILDNVSARIHNAIAGIFGGKRMNPQPLQFGDKHLTLDQRAHREAAKSDPQGKERWGADLFKDLPTLPFQKGLAGAKILFGNAVQKQEMANAAAGAEGRDNAIRNRAERVQAHQQAMGDFLGGRVPPAVGRAPGRAQPREVAPRDPMAAMIDREQARARVRAGTAGADRLKQEADAKRAKLLEDARAADARRMADTEARRAAILNNVKGQPGGGDLKRPGGDDQAALIPDRKADSVISVLGEILRAVSFEGAPTGTG